MRQKAYSILNCLFSKSKHLFGNFPIHCSGRTHRRTFKTVTPLLSSNENDHDEDLLKNIDAYMHPGTGYNLLLIQPRLKFNETKSVSELKLNEATALVKTLPGWNVVEKHIIATSSLKASLIFGTGNIDYITSMIRTSSKITAVFIGVDILTGLQTAKLEESFKVPVFDRYQVILQIFHNHAHTREAKLQLALAEIPYLRVKLAIFSHTRYTSMFPGIQHVGGDGETFMEMRRRLLNERELKIKKELEKIKNQREVLRRSEIRQNLPLIAVVGYTNCGKTTLIKSLTDDSRLQPEDKLFATLDVTLHPGMLPSNQKVFFIDTVGFISDVPTALITSFKSTLEEINLADLVVHVRDLSHPDAESQKATVLKTLAQLDLSPKLLDSVLEVNNKIDLIESFEPAEDSEALYISATDGTGLRNLLDSIEEKLYENTGRGVSLLKIPNGGPQYTWLLREAAIRDSMADPKDANYLIVEVVITQAHLAKFKHMFGDLTVSLESLKQ